MKRVILLLPLTFYICFSYAAGEYSPLYLKSKEFQALRDSMSHAFNDGDSARFYPALKALQAFLLKKNDMHGYYTQRCNEVVFLMNQQHIYEAYKCALTISKELREKNLESEMYMAKNLLGHINRYCGNGEEAKQNWFEVLDLMKKYGYISSMPPIYLNIVNVALDDSAEEADSLLEIAKEIAAKYSQERLFDIETRHSLSYYNRGDFDRFLEGYKAYKEGLAKGYSTVHGRSMEVYYLACTGEVDKAVAMARKELGDEGVDVIPLLYERSGRWEDAYKALKKSAAVSDSIDNVIIINSMQGIRDEISLYESKVEEARYKLIGLSAIILLLSLLIIALVYIVQTRRRHLKELQKAYNRAMESENMKAAFIRNISHEIRTPLNIISGFSQVIADPELTDSVEERQHMAGMIQTNAHHVTTLLDEIIGLSLIESTHMMSRNDELEVNKALREKLEDYESVVQEGVKLNYQTSLSDDFTILTNANMFTRIINCLLENAAKYTTKGSITLSASRDDQILSIIVEDTGCGIPVEEAEHIFERFVKLDNFKEGIGLGLPLSRKLAEQLGGTVAFDKSYSNGARFIVDLPITKIPAK